MYSITELKEAVKNSICISDVCKYLNISICTFNYKRIKKLCEENFISLEHFDVQKAVRRNKFEYTFDMIFVADSKIPRFRLREQIIRYKIFEKYKCFTCEISEWQGNPLTLEIDHINGISNDNRIENLRWLCPNCHSQTPTFRNKKR